MLRGILNSRFRTLLLILGGLLIIGGYYLFQPERNRETSPSRLSQTPIPDKDSSRQSLPRLPDRIEAGPSRPPVPVGTPVPRPSIPADKRARLAALDGLSSSKAQEKGIEILTEGMDALSAAKYLKALNGFYGIYDDAIREYVDRAVSENPDSFEALLLWSQLRPPEQNAEREAGFRKLLKMDPNSVDALVGLGTVLHLNDLPEEAPEYLQKAVELRPRESGAHVTLAMCYHKLNRLEEALATYEKAHQLYPGELSQTGLDHVKSDIEWARTQGNREAVPE